MRPSSDSTKMKNSTQTTLPHFSFSVTAELNDVTSSLIILINETCSRSPCMRPRSDPRTLVKSNVVRSRLIILINEEINEANWMVSNNAKLNRKTKQHTQFGVSAINGSRDMARTKSWRKKKIDKNNGANCMISNSAKLASRTKQLTQSGVSTSDGSKDMAATKSWRKKKKIKKNNKANWMVSYSAKLDSRTKRHTQSGVSESNGSRDMARTKSWRKKAKKKEKKSNKANWIVSNSAQLDRRTKQHTQFGVSASNGSRDMARTKSWQNHGEKNK